MHKVVTINLNGRAYQFDENAFDAIRAYLDRAEAQLGQNPDRAEILADLEQAIADKCHRYLNEHKTVVALPEIARVLEEMGPVEGAADSSEPGAKGPTSATGEQPRSAGAPGARGLCGRGRYRACFQSCRHRADRLLCDDDGRTDRRYFRGTGRRTWDPLQRSGTDRSRGAQHRPIQRSRLAASTA